MGHMLKLKCSHSLQNLRILSSTSVPFRPTTVQMPNLALVETKRITVQALLMYLTPPQPVPRQLKYSQKIVNFFLLFYKYFFNVLPMAATAIMLFSSWSFKTSRVVLKTWPRNEARLLKILSRISKKRLYHDSRRSTRLRNFHQDINLTSSPPTL